MNAKQLMELTKAELIERLLDAEAELKETQNNFRNPQGELRDSEGKYYTFDSIYKEGYQEGYEEAEAEQKKDDDSKAKPHIWALKGIVGQPNVIVDYIPLDKYKHYQNLLNEEGLSDCVNALDKDDMLNNNTLLKNLDIDLFDFDDALEELDENGYVPIKEDDTLVDGVPLHLRDIVCEYYNWIDETIDDMYYYEGELYVTLKH